jgi:hypothetical protein
MAGRSYLVSVDPAGGGGDGDLSAVEVLDLESGLQCAEFAGHLGGLALTELATQLAEEYNRAWLVVERNNHGAAILAFAETACCYARVYSQGNETGWMTTPASRPVALGRLGAMLVEEPECFSSRRFLAECRGFVHLPNGRMSARAGTHDDLVMAMAIAFAAREDLLTRAR